MCLERLCGRKSIPVAGGHTLPEVLAAMAIISLLAWASVQAWRWVHARNRLAAAVNTLVAAFALGRQEAIMRGERVHVCMADEAGICQDSRTGRWIVVKPKGGAPVVKLPVPGREAGIGHDDEIRITTNEPLREGLIFNALGAGVRPNGAFLAGSLWVCHRGLADGRRIVIARGGRVRLERAACGR